MGSTGHPADFTAAHSPLSLHLVLVLWLEGGILTEGQGQQQIPVCVARTHFHWESPYGILFTFTSSLGKMLKRHGYHLKKEENNASIIGRVFPVLYRLRAQS